MADKYAEVGLDVNEILCKKSHVDNCMNSLGIQIVDELQEVVFVRILKVGEGMADSPVLKKGHLVTIHKGVAVPVPWLTLQHNCPHYVVKHHDIVALIREFEIGLTP